MAEKTLSPLIEALLDRARIGGGRAVRVVETHISWVLLTGDLAYKIKKPVDLGFLDFSTLESRRRYCLEEVRLNRRLAPDLYLGVVAIAGSWDRPVVGGEGPALEYAVQLKQFDEDCLAERVIGRNGLSPRHMDDLARTLAEFHTQAARAGQGDAHGAPETVLAAAEHNFDHLLGSKPSPELSTTLPCRLEEDHSAGARVLLEWTRAEFERLREFLASRKREGFVRECHGDLHCGNLVLVEDRLIPFDCIEFSEDLRWIDCISEIAFVVMDLEARGRPDLAWRLLNRYLEITGDYPGLEAFRFYLSYRAMVRAKVSDLCLEHAGEGEERRGFEAQRSRYLAEAQSHARPRTPVLIITHGFSGSGKSRLAQRLAERLPAVRIASDIERKRLAGFAAGDRTGSSPVNIYSESFSLRTYGLLIEYAERLLRSGLNVILDATFLRADQRNSCRSLAERLGAGFLILDLQAPAAVLRERVSARLSKAVDPSEADLGVLARQMAEAEAFREDEKAHVWSLDTGAEPDLGPVLNRCADLAGSSGCRQRAGSNSHFGDFRLE